MNAKKTVSLLAASLMLAGTLPAQPAAAPTFGPITIAPGKYEPTMASLTNYQCPTWFRDAKFGIWAHWGPQAVPMDGDWYARGLYEPGNKHYTYHTNHYGHPSEFGYKDIIPLWKAEKWDPDRLMQIYKKAGAKYFVSMGTHHDNFFLWNSKLHRWNAVNMGPKRDVVGDWQKAAQKYGLRFGVSEHLGASFTWFQSSHRSDKAGPKAGVPYDGANPEYWDLYHFPAEPGDTGWYSKNPKWQQEWFAEIKELVDNYHPDLLYSDGGVPFGNEVGLSMIAHLYNANAAQHGGKAEVIYNCKQKSEGRWVEDLERGIMPKIDPYPWQTDTSIGDWFYDRNWKFRPLSWVIHMLVDNVSKNGNLLLNIVQRPDGSLDPEVERMLEQLAAWNAVHGEGIFGTRPWFVYGESSVRVKGGAFKEDFKYNAKEIRFTTKGETLYAFALGWPEDGKLLIKSLAKTADTAQNEISQIELLGHDGKVEFTQTADGLAVTLPAEKTSDVACCLRIAGKNFRPAPMPTQTTVIQADSRGNFALSADTADLHGDGIKAEEQGGQPNLGFWDNASDWASWTIQVEKPGRYKVSGTFATTHADVEVGVDVGTEKLTAKVPQTSDWAQFRTTDFGQVEIKQAGDQVLAVRARNPAAWKAVNLRSVKLTRQP